MREVLIIDIFKTSEEDILKAPIDLIVLHFANEYANVDLNFFRVDRDDFQNSRYIFLRDFLIALVRLAQHGHGAPYIRGIVGSFRQFVRFSDRNELVDFNNYDEIISHAQSYRLQLVERVRLKEIKRRTAASYISNLKNILIELLPINYHDRIDRLRISKKLIATDITSAPSDEELLQYIEISEIIFNQLSNFVLKNTKFPIHLNFRSNKYALTPHGNFPFCNIEKGPDIQTATRYVWNYEKLYIRSLASTLEAAKLDNKTLTKKTAYKAIQRVRKRLHAVNSYEYHVLRFRLARLANEAFIILFIAATGMNITQASQLNWESDDFVQDRPSVHFRTIKNRAWGKIVEFEIATDFIRLFKQYLKLRKYLFRASESYNVESLLVDFVEKSPRRVTARCRQEYNNKLEFFFDFGVHLNFREIRVGKAQRLAAEHGIFLASQKMQNSPSTFVKHYLRGNKVNAIKELSTFFSSYSEVLIEDIVETTTTVLGQCKTINDPEKVEDNAPYLPNCLRPEGCLFCKKFAVHADRISLKKLLSFSYILNLTALSGFKKSGPELKAVNSRIEHLTSLICNAANIKDTELNQIKHSIEVENTMPEFWQYKLELLSDLGVV